eukprot:gnl/MRDRNA2_/MRDRNA2_77842_c0_seq1.p1 gnl/MRDRNA2_/MRDRNA2_77842_c0~~gnl/MRDRNA2_/MRDRNA2_77842_c0_seq1.p1  ORF type:complete len:544 (+),score=111.83 gnl/MRDRNA2_/MRDRNA2_77842_c0_seq1:81-1712(+)
MLPIQKVAIGEHEDGEADVNEIVSSPIAARRSSLTQQLPGSPKKAEPKKGAVVRKRMTAMGGGMFEAGQYEGFGHVENVINGIMLTKSVIDMQKLRTLIKERLLVYPRFCSRGAVVDGVPMWEEVDPENVDLCWHVVSRDLPEPAGQLELDNLIAQEAEDMMPIDRPLWRFIVLKNYQSSEGRGAILARISHAIGDGTTIVHVLFSLLDEMKQKPSTGVVKRKIPPSVSCADAMNPLRLADALGDWFFGMYMGLFAMAVTKPDPPNPFRTPRNQWDQTKMQFRMAPCKIPLSQIKEISHQMNCTVNDVLVAVLGAAMGAYMRQAEDYGEVSSMRMLAPVNMRSAATLKSENEFGNQFVMAVIHVPVGCEDPLETLKLSKQELDRLKKSPEMPLIMFLNVKLMAKLKIPIEKRMELMNDIFEKFSLLFTNVPGPTTACVLGGTEIVDIMFFVSGVAGKMPTVTLITYKEQLRVGFSINPNQVKDVSKLMDLFASEMEKLRKVAPTSSPQRLKKSVCTVKGFAKLPLLAVPFGCLAGVGHCLGLV